jgi:hypothetical protein
MVSVVVRTKHSEPFGLNEMRRKLVGVYSSCPAYGTTTIPSLDKEYRKGVHWLETLRLRRTKILENGYKVYAESTRLICP